MENYGVVMHNVVTAEPYASDCTAEVAKQTTFVAQTASMVATTIKTMVVVASVQQNPSMVAVVVVPPVATIAVTAPFYGPLPSHSMDICMKIIIFIPNKSAKCPVQIR